MSQKYKEIPTIDFMKLDDGYYIYLEGHSETKVSRGQLESFRDHIHNLLLYLNTELEVYK